MSPMTSTGGRRAAPLIHAAIVVAAFTGLFMWVFGELLASNVYLAESDLYDWFLPFFLSPPARWSSDIFAGFPLVADTSNAIQYPVYFFFARIAGSWNGYVIAAYVIGASLAYAYVFTVVRSRTAAAVAGVAYGLSEAMVARQAHINFVHAFAWFPLMVLSADRLASGGSRRWVAVGAAATACCFLAGHPQPVLYAAPFCVVYGAVAAWRERAPRAVWLKLAAMFALSGLLMAIKAVPFAEATQYIGRQSVGFDQFVSHANTPVQMLNLLFPSVAHDSREAPLYVGFSVLALGALALTRAGRHWRITFWLIAGVFVLLIGAGGSTPVARLLYLLPVYRRSRVITRMLFIAAFGAATLAGFGVAFMQQRQLSRRAARMTVTGLLLLVAAVAAWLTTRADVPFAAGQERMAGLPLWNIGVWEQLMLIVIATALLFWALDRSRTRLLGVVLIPLIAVDLLHGLPYSVGATGLRLITVPVSATAPSVHARQVAADLAPLHQRWMAIAGTTRDAVLPSGFARLWHIPVAGGYGPILLANFQALATAGNNGEIRPELLAEDDHALDLLAVREIVVREDDFPASPTFHRDEHEWNEPSLNMRIGRDDCGYPYRRARSMRLRGRTIDRLSIVAHLRCSEDVPRGAEAGAVEIADSGAGRWRQSLVAGVNIAEYALTDAAVRARARHAPAPNRFEDPELPGDVYLVNIDLPQRVSDPTITFTSEATGGWLAIDRVTARGSDGVEHPLSLVDLLLHDDRRWKELRRIRTSTVTDRERDEIDPLELEYTVYDNLQALPRAWMASDLRPLGDADVLAAVRFAQLPDGSPFDPRVTALVSPADGGVAARRYASGAMQATVDAIGDGRIAVTASSDSGGFLVLSETYYPGWSARLDDVTVPVRRTDYSLQGVEVPAGKHTVVFTFASRAGQIGGAMSIAAVLLCAALVMPGGLVKTCSQTAAVHVDPIQ